MQLQPSAEQEALQEGIRAFCSERLGLEKLAGLARSGGFESALWRDLADLGIFQLRVPEADGGLGLGASEAALVSMELGHALAPGPILWSQLAAEILPGAATGKVVAGGLDCGGHDSGPSLIEHPEAIDRLLLIRTDGVFCVDASALKGRIVESPLDPLTPIRVVAKLPAGEPIADAETASRLRLEGLNLVSAQLFGIARATLEIALAYAKEREQFGRSIGSFQAIKHLLSDMFARQELARAAVHAGAASLDHPDAHGPEQAVRGAKIVASEAATRNARACIQIHGGMGYTWEVIDHYYLKRAAVLEVTFAPEAENAERIANIIADSSTEAHHVVT